MGVNGPPLWTIPDWPKPQSADAEVLAKEVKRLGDANRVLRRTVGDLSNRLEALRLEFDELHRALRGLGRGL